MLTGGTAQFLQSIPTHPYLIGGTIALDRLLDFVERIHESAGKKRRRIKQMRKEQEQSLEAIENLQDAVDSAAKSCMHLVWKLEYEFSDSLLS